jgi:hypothetical protein
MTQEKKDLLLKDLSARLFYGVKASYYGAEEECETWDEIEGITLDGYVDIGQYSLPIERIKPYLFPISTLTEELKTFIRWKLTIPFYETFDEESLEDLLNNNIQVVNFCYENHIDINGLIEKGLAIDATGKNIY